MKDQENARLRKALQNLVVVADELTQHVPENYIEDKQVLVLCLDGARDVLNDIPPVPLDTHELLVGLQEAVHHIEYLEERWGGNKDLIDRLNSLIVKYV